MLMTPLMPDTSPEFDFSTPDDSFSDPQFDAESAVYNFIYWMSVDDFETASTYICSAGQAKFFEQSESEENLLSGADTSRLTVVVELDAGETSGRLNFEGEVIVKPGTDEEITIPAFFIPYNDVPMFIESGQWVICPDDLLE
jgi:hypothetical protein